MLATLVQVLSFAAFVSAASVPRVAGCTAEQRLAGAEGVVTAYNQRELGGTADGFLALPFGIGDSHGECITSM